MILAKKPGCIHCGHPFGKQDTSFKIVDSWRVHLLCWQRYSSSTCKGFKGCLSCYQKGKTQ